MRAWLDRAQPGAGLEPHAGGPNQQRGNSHERRRQENAAQEEGKAKEAAGKVSGNKRLGAERKADEGGAKIKQADERVNFKN
jgi:uncharacterized protein YjbJ (UPF0337 family)